MKLMLVNLVSPHFSCWPPRLCKLDCYTFTVHVVEVEQDTGYSNENLF